MINEVEIVVTKALNPKQLAAIKRSLAIRASQLYDAGAKVPAESARRRALDAEMHELEEVLEYLMK